MYVDAPTMRGMSCGSDVCVGGFGRRWRHRLACLYVSSARHSRGAMLGTGSCGSPVGGSAGRTGFEKIHLLFIDTFVLEHHGILSSQEMQDAESQR